ncbi:PR domain zinc finger protein 5-like [Cloeon dipterum]|uniref:PR domain zinc finger protein 5-like n=1 Tax=Cloeon dipterum TaxID=197152 RepID=UPI00321FACF0
MQIFYLKGGAAVVTDEKLVSVSKLLPESHRVVQAIEAVHAGRGKNVPLLSKTRSVEEAMDLLSTPQTPSLHFLFHCSKCNSNLSNSFELLEHDLQKFSCKRCPRKFCTAKLQRKHRVEHQEKIIISHSENMAKHSCRLCEARFNSSMQLALHLDLHRGARYECDACNRHFQHKIHLARHIKLKHLALYHFRCNFCQLQFSSRMEVVQHVQEHDDSDLLRSDAPKFELVTPYKCEICGECKSSPVVLRKHAEKHGSQDKTNDPASRKCHLCDKQFKTEKNLRTHITMGHLRGAHIFVRTRVSSPKKHACSQCPRRFRRIRELADHLSFFHSNILQYSCNFCQKRFGTNAGRKVHIYGKRPMSEYPCGACDAKFESKCERDLHQTQQHEQRFPCTICGACFGRKSQLHGHVGRKHAHQTAKSFYCDVCGNGFNIATKFKKHSLSHLGQ